MSRKRLRTEFEGHVSTRFVDRTASLIWKIRGILTKCRLQNREMMTSPNFDVPGTGKKYCLQIYPKGRAAEDEDYISIYVSCQDQAGPAVLACVFFLIDASGKRKNRKEFCKLFDENGSSCWGYPKFVSHEELLNSKADLLPDDELTVSCVVTVVEKIEDSYELNLVPPEQESASDEPTSTFLSDWEAAFHQNEDTDFVLKVSGETIRAHRIVLTSRSSVFAAMFRHDMLESSTNEVEIPDVDPDVFGELLKFLYTDRLSIADVGFATNLLMAAEKYDVPSLRKRCGDFLCQNLSVDNVFGLLRIANVCGWERLGRACMHLIRSEMSLTPSLLEWIEKLNDSPENLTVVKERFAENK